MAGFPGGGTGGLADAGATARRPHLPGRRHARGSRGARPGLAAVITRDPYRLTFARLGSGRIVRRAPLPSKGRHLAASPSGRTVLVPAEEANQLVEVPVGGGPERRIDVGEHPHDAVQTHGRIFVGDEFADTVSVVEHGRLERTLDAPAQPGGVAAAAGLVAVVAVAERVIATYDANTLRRLGQAPAGEGPTHLLAAGRRAWVADTEGDAILVFRLAATPRQIASVPAPGTPYGMALDARRDILWVTLTATNRVEGFDVSGAEPRRIASFPVLRQPNSVAVDEPSGRVVVAGADSGRLEVLPGARG